MSQASRPTETSISDEELKAAFRHGFKLAHEIATGLGQTILPAGTRVLAKFDFCDHRSLGTIKGCTEGSALPLGKTFGYLVLLDVPIPRGFRPAEMPFVPYTNIEVVS